MASKQSEIAVERSGEVNLVLGRPCFEVAFPLGHPFLEAGELQFTAGEVERTLPVGEGHEDAGYRSFRFPRPKSGVSARLVHRAGQTETVIHEGSLDALLGRGGKLSAPFAERALAGGLGELWARLVHPLGLLVCEGSLTWTRGGEAITQDQLGPGAELPASLPASGDLRARGLPPGRYAVALEAGGKRYPAVGLPWVPSPPGPSSPHWQRLSPGAGA